MQYYYQGSSDTGWQGGGLKNRIFDYENFDDCASGLRFYVGDVIH